MTKTTLHTLLCIAMLLLGQTAMAQKLTVTLIGTGSGGFGGDNRSGVNSSIGAPTDVCKDAAGNIYLTDVGNGRIRKWVASQGILTTIAGGGTSTADNIPATDAVMAPNYMCIDAAGNIYVSTVYAVRKITASTGLIKTIAGTEGTSGYSGDSGPAVSALMKEVNGICLDGANNLYIADAGNYRIRKVNLTTGIISTVAGTGVAGHTGDGGAALSAQINLPIAITANAAGQLFFSDDDGKYIRKIDLATGIISHVAGDGTVAATGNGGPADVAGVGRILGICVNDSGDVDVDDYSCACREIDMTSGLINRIAGSLVIDGYNGDGGNSMNMLLNFPSGLCANGAGGLYIADHSNNRIRKIMQLTHKPEFAFDRYQTITPCANTTMAVEKQMAIGDMDPGQTETWTVISGPAHGTLGGYPQSRTSMGTDTVTTPLTMTYTPASGYTGNDAFTIRVSDGTYSDTTTIYVNVSNPTAGGITGPDSVCTGAYNIYTPSVDGGIWSVTNANAYFMTSATLMAAVAGRDTILYTFTETCTQTDTFAVVINESPDAGIITGGHSSLCLGSTMTLSDAVPGGIWGDGGMGILNVSATGVVNGLTYGSDAVSYTVSNALCTASATMYVTIDSMPVAETISGASLVAAGSTILLTTTGMPYEGVWSSGDMSIAVVDYTGVVTGVSAGVATISYTKTNDCGSAYSTHVVTVQDNTGVKGVSGAIANVTVMPNPSHGNFGIKITSGVTEAAQVAVMNILGEKVATFTGYTNSTIETALNAPTGIYMLYITTDHGSASYKVVVE